MKPVRSVFGLCLGSLLASTAWGQSPATPIPTPLPTISSPIGSESVLPLPPAMSAIPLMESVPQTVSPAPATEPKSPSVFSKMPPLQTVALPGGAPIPPTNDGYYTGLDWLLDQAGPPPKSPFPRFALVPFSFENSNYRPLDSVPFDERDIWESLKRIPVGDDWMFSMGGEFRWRYADETNSRLTGVRNTYDLFRTRLYGDLYYRDRFRFFVEGLFAESVNQNLPFNAVDINRGDIHEAFADLRLFDFGEDHRVWVRGGRQELIYGSQRLLSPSEWGNVRRRFDGVKLYERSEKWDLDLWVTSPVLNATNSLDSTDRNVVFTGAWNTFRPAKGHYIDLYYLNLDNTNPVSVGAGGRRGGHNISTFGFRALSNANAWMYDVEAAWQTGRWVNQDISAAMFSGGVGYHWKERPWNPQLWFFYDFASGDNDPLSGKHTTFNHLYSFGHFYFGYNDVVGRQNIHDFNVQFALYPSEWITTQAQFHVFHLAEARDALYGPVGAPLRRDITGRAGTDVGQELDWIVNFHLTKHQDLLIGYSHLFTGDFIRATGAGGDLDTIYVQYNYRW
ncbi:alginate export family protein [Tuwongella immobilis]|uniref:Alginate export domain-containing protein n=1 Tax=Tuwongella immobilis TaxID=692036 RepID=A0A6C2YST4_9BACT|nr:alginate export family protein [Tuwongella immobilis]VIP04434.1 Uncharacterized protein OS=Nitrosospira multiformis (strain ATCC 25196 / NCIMB 11849) GN=Nmul_A0937 PE=4 SV=1: Alginate_exp [Tuwongella immobilis]VTS06230.1 Uncharacterized protein OS=Nitrosospira multiformis (strain ATCC 25196 / NCIMB 11849) GN=Nmul_A0937 PE=4 SV=1: Alginate_exp [Tuwongella immobilis]